MFSLRWTLGTMFEIKILNPCCLFQSIFFCVFHQEIKLYGAKGEGFQTPGEVNGRFPPLLHAWLENVQRYSWIRNVHFGVKNRTRRPCYKTEFRAYSHRPKIPQEIQYRPQVKRYHLEYLNSCHYRTLAWLFVVDWRQNASVSPANEITCIC